MYALIPYLNVNLKKVFISLIKFRIYENYICHVTFIRNDLFRFRSMTF